MFERPASGESAVLVQLDFGEGDFDERLAEFRLLLSSAGAQAVGVVTGRRAAPDPARFAGKGKVTEIGDYMAPTWWFSIMNSHRANSGILNANSSCGSSIAAA